MSDLPKDWQTLPDAMRTWHNLAMHPQLAPEVKHDHIEQVLNAQANAVAVIIQRLEVAGSLLRRWIETCARWPDQTANRTAIFTDTDRWLVTLGAEGEPATCTWKQDDIDDLWETSCGQAWTFIDGGPEDNHVRFCHSCGRPIVAIAAEVEESEGA